MNINEETLRKLVERDGKSFSEVANILGKNVGQISNMAKRYGIVSKHMSKIARKPLPIDEIYNIYVNQKKSLDFLNKKYKTPIARIKKQLKHKYPNIVFRTMAEAKRPIELNNPSKLDEYAVTDMTSLDISRMLGVKEQTVIAAYKRLNKDRYKRQIDKVVIPKSDLNKLYWGDKKLSSTKIAEIYGTNHGNVIDLLREYNIPVRNQGGARRSSHKELNERNWLYEEYVTKDRSMSSIKDEIGTSIGNVAHYLKKYEIPIKSKEEVCDKLTGHGTNWKFNSKKHGVIKCDSLMERSFLEKFDNCDNLRRVNKAFKYEGIIAYIDFEIDGQLVEIKAPSESNISGPDRSRLVKQYLVAKKNNIEIKIWNGKFIDLQLDDRDIYYSSNWKLNFDCYEDCYNWLIKYGYKNIEWSRHKLCKGLKRYYDIIKSPNDLLDAKIQAEPVMSLIKHFSQHFYRSYHSNYMPISAAWEIGNQSVLRDACRKLWESSKNVTIYGLARLIGKFYKDFSPVSIFKPWVAAYIYDKYLPKGGVVIDPCMGWGGRLFGCLDKNIKYYGYDLNPNSIKANKDLKKFLGHRIGETLFSCADSSVIDFPDGDLLFTSPPYDNCEHYHGINSAITQTKPILENIFKKFGGIVALNVPKRQEELCISIAKNHGFKLFEKLEMKTASFMGREKTYEPILIFKK